MKRLLLILCFFYSPITFAQIALSDGFVIFKDQTDTVKGKIEYLNWSVNPIKIRFQQTGQDIKEVATSALESFGIYGKENYVSRKVDLDETPITSTNLLKSKELLIKRDTTLALLVLLKAQYSLYYLKDNNEKEHFFIDQMGATTELINHKFLTERDTKIYEIDDERYIKQLTSLFSICSKKTISVSGLRYEMNAITQKMIDFNECMGCQYTCYIKKSVDKVFTTFELIGGANMENIKHEYISTSGSMVSKYVLTPGVALGASYSLHSKRDNGNNIARFELLYENMVIKSVKFANTSNMPFINLNIIYRKNNTRTHFLYGVGIGSQVWLGTNLKNPVASYVNGYKPLLIIDVGYSVKKFDFILRGRVPATHDYVYFADNLSSESAFLKNTKFQLLCSYTFTKSK